MDNTKRYHTMKVFISGTYGMPDEIETEIWNLWEHLEFGNDCFYFSGNIEDLEEMTKFKEPDMTHTLKWIKDSGVENDETFLIHHWW